MLQAIWQEHRPFILRIAAGMAVFLILMNFVVGYRVEGREETDRAVESYEQVARDLERLSGKHRQEQRNATVWGERVDGLRDRLAIGGHLRIQPPEDIESTNIDFSRRFSEIFRAFADRANRSTIAYPEQNDIDFRESKSLDADQWRDRYIQLEIVRRILDAGVDAQIDRFISIRPESLVVEPIAGDPELAHYRYPVVVEFVAGYAEALSFLRGFQQEEVFLSVEVNDVGSESVGRGADTGGKLRLRVTAVGIDLGAEREEGSSSRKPKGFGF